MKQYPIAQILRKKNVNISLFFLPILLMLSCTTEEWYDLEIYKGENCIENNELYQPEFLQLSHDTLFCFIEGSKIQTKKNTDIEEVTIQNLIITDGGKIVFDLSMWSDPSISFDDELREKITFEIPSDIDYFVISDSNLEKANTYYGFWCFRCPVGYYPISNGCIVGKKLNKEEWLININITIDINGTARSKMLSCIVPKMAP